MDVTVRCPHCDVKLIVDEADLGRRVVCDDCDRPFTAEQSEHPRRRKPAKVRRNTLAPMLLGSTLVMSILGVAVGLFYAFGFHRSSARSSTSFAPQTPTDRNVSNTSRPTPAWTGAAGPPPAVAPPQPAALKPAVGVQTFTLTSARWGSGGPIEFPGEFTVDYQYTGDHRPIGRFQLAWKTADGTRGSSQLLGLLNSNGSVSVRLIGVSRRPDGGLTLWIEEGGIPGPFGQPGVRVSNEFLLAN